MIPRSATLLFTAMLGFSMLSAQPAPGSDPKWVMAKATEDLIKSGQAQRAIQQGQMAPDFVLPDAKGRPVRLSERLRKGPIVLTFYRGGWCPFCNIQLRSYQEKIAEIRALGADLVAVSPQTPDHTVSTVEKASLTFEVLSDVGNKVARSYGLVFKVPDPVVNIYKANGVDLETSNGDASHELPLAGTYIIGMDGKVLLAFVDADYKKRLPVARILDVLKSTAK